MLIAVCGGLPSYYKDGPDAKWFRKAAPKWSWWSEWKEKFGTDPDSAESVSWYTERYRRTVLDALDPENTFKELTALADGHDAYLLCYETPDKFCHRRLLAEWLNGAIAAGTEKIKEWKDEDKI